MRRSSWWRLLGAGGGSRRLCSMQNIALRFPMLAASCREGMTREEAEQLVKEAVALAMARDGSSGGVIRMVAVHAGGADRSLVLPQVLGS